MPTSPPRLTKPLPPSARGVLRRKQEDPSLWVFMALFCISTLLFLVPSLHLEHLLGIEQQWWIDALQHILFYLFFCIVLFKLIPFQKRNLSFFLFIFTISVFFEAMQTLFYDTPYSYADTASNLVGISTGFLFYGYLHRRKQRTRKRR